MEQPDPFAGQSWRPGASPSVAALTHNSTKALPDPGTLLRSYCLQCLGPEAVVWGLRNSGTAGFLAGLETLTTGSSCKALVLTWAQLAMSQDTCCCHNRRGALLAPVGRGRRHYHRCYNSQDSPRQEFSGPEANSAVAKKPCSRVSCLCLSSDLWGPSRDITFVSRAQPQPLLSSRCPDWSFPALPALSLPCSPAGPKDERRSEKTLFKSPSPPAALPPWICSYSLLLRTVALREWKGTGGPSHLEAVP